MVDICAYCGSEATTRDHVVPQCLYPPSKRGSSLQLLTVPACKTCQKLFQADEENFRSLIVTGGGRTPVVDELFFGKVSRSLEGPKGKPKLSWLLSLMKEHQTLHGKELRLYPDERVKRVLRKITRGLAYHHFGLPVPDERVFADVDKYGGLRVFGKLCRWHERDSEVFRYGYATVPGASGIHSGWFLTIYTNRHFVAVIVDLDSP